MKLIVMLLIVVLIVLIINHLFPVIQVIGDSMFPTYIDGEYLFGTRVFRKSTLKEGEVIIYRSPTEEDRVVIKRIDSILKDSQGGYHYYCLGDNAECSYDSRNYGYVPSKNVVCKVVNQRRKQ